MSSTPMLSILGWPSSFNELTVTLRPAAAYVSAILPKAGSHLARHSSELPSTAVELNGRTTDFRQRDRQSESPQRVAGAGRTARGRSFGALTRRRLQSYWLRHKTSGMQLAQWAFRVPSRLVARAISDWATIERRRRPSPPDSAGVRHVMPFVLAVETMSAQERTTQTS